ncbi:MAG: flagellar basal body rod protein FlgC [Ignavibacteriales bacterium]|nr:flagellar basal body rod protein FlgC [Ignavibacteriales bacterium]
MKIEGSLFGLNFSSRGMSIQRKKMDLISQNIANADSIRTENGDPYKRKYLKVEADQKNFVQNLNVEGQMLHLNATNQDHLLRIQAPQELSISADQGKVALEEIVDQKDGDIVYMPDHPDANKDGYVEMSNVNVINEMVDMIAATRSYEANLQALNSAKQMAKDSLEI